MSEQITALAGWENFYVIVGSSAGALIGLQFVVITLIADMPRVRDIQPAGSAFATPTIVHFSAVLLLAGILCAPWPSVAAAAVAWGLLGVFGLVYEIVVVRRMQRQTAYEPEFEDWLFHVVLPFAAYGALAVSVFATRSYLREALFAVAGAAMLLLFIGIHNAWDAVTYHVFLKGREQQGAERRETS